jgi:hypothetical protein
LQLCRHNWHKHSHMAAASSSSSSGLWSWINRCVAAVGTPCC